MATVSRLERLSPKDYAKEGLTSDRLLDLYKKMLKVRKFDETVEELYYKGLVKGPTHLYIGQEGIASGAISALEAGDYMISHYRGHGHAVAKGIPMRMVMAEILGKATGTCKGLGGSMHVPIFPELNSLFASAIVGSTVPIAAGVGFAIKYKGSDRIVLSFFGDGAVNSGGFHEGMSLASIWKLPVVYVCENNQYAMSMPVSKAVTTETIAQRSLAYNVNSVFLDGNDAPTVYVAIKKAMVKARKGEGPVFLECMTYRHRGHTIYTTKLEKRPKEEVDEWMRRDPIKRLEDHLLQSRVVSGEDEIRAMKEEVNVEAKDAVEFAIKSPYLSYEEMTSYVFA